MKLAVQSGSENYTALVIKLPALQKVEGLDNLVRVDIMGNSCLVGKDTNLDELHLFFPAECKLSAEFLYANSLFRHTGLNKNPDQKGFFEDNGRVKAIKFKGMVSTGFVIPVSSLYYFKGLDLKVGQEFNTIDGRLVCEKNVRRGKNPDGTPKSVRIIDQLVDSRMAPEHFSTAHLLKNIGELKLDDYIAVTHKLHGCFTPNSKVIMADGTKKRISAVKTGEFVLGYDETTKQIVKSKVLNSFIMGYETDWIKLKFNKIKLGDFPTTQSTAEHKFFTSNRGYVEAQDVIYTDTILQNREIFNLTRIQKSILVGKLLGDAYIDRHTNNRSVVYGHKVAHQEYINYCISTLGNISTGVLRSRISGYDTSMLDTRTRHDYSFNILTKDWIVNNKKVVPNNIKLDKYSLAFWYMDDGSLSHTELQQDRANFAVCGFTEQDVELLVLYLKAYGFKSPIKYLADGYWRIRLNKNDADKLYADICELIPDCLQYKLPVKYRGRFNPPTSQVAEKIQFAIPTTLKSKEFITRAKTGKYDIETETNNFFCNNILVHNSSLRVFNTLTKRQLPWYEMLASKLGFNIITDEYNYVVGSRSDRHLDKSW